MDSSSQELRKKTAGLAVSVELPKLLMLLLLPCRCGLLFSVNSVKIMNAHISYVRYLTQLEMCQCDIDAPALGHCTRETRNVSMGHGCPRYCQIRINRALTLTKGHNSDYNRWI